ncbi:MAG TPA: tetratricopeptide repeat protein, partial [Candidatus Eisenbacteria bacterium]|nr:tetratricopeptide repeat protein [Candidatus Eisenbacteria bacterium]
VVLLARVGERWGGRVGGLVAGLGAALYGPFVFFESDLLSIALAVFLLEVALFFWGEPRRSWVAGLALGGSALAQPNFLLAGGLAVAASWVWPRHLGWPDRRAVRWLALGLLLLPALTLTRNLAVTGQPILISANGGVNFFIGNNPAADGTFHLPPDSGLLNRTEGLFTSAKEVAERELGRSLGASAVDRFWWLRGLDFWLTYPARAMGLTLGKLMLSLNDAEIPSHYDYTFFRESVPVLRFLPTFGWVLPLGGIGLALAWRRRHVVPAVLSIAFLLSIVPFFITGRYRLPLAVFLWPAAGYAVAMLWAARKEWRVLWPVGAALAGYAVLTFFPLYASGTTRAHMLNVEATTLVQAGKLDEAERMLKEALALSPEHPEVLNNLAYVEELRGNTEGALALYERAVARDPRQAETYFNIESLHRQAHRYGEALQVLDRLERGRGGQIEDVASRLAYLRGVNTVSLGDTAQGRAELETAVARDSTLAEAWLTLSTLYRRTGRFADALGAADRAVRLTGGAPEALVNRGRSYEMLGNLDPAEKDYAEALAQGGGDAELSYHLGLLYLRQSRLPEAEQRFLAANQGRPHTGALWELGQIYERQGRIEEARTAYRALSRFASPQTAKAKERLRALRTQDGDATG